MFNVYRSTVMKFLQSYWRSCWQRRLVCIFAGLFLLGSICWIGVNLYGARQLRRVEAMLRADGETLDYSELMTTRIPDNENYCAIPILREVAMGFSENMNEAAPRLNPARLEAFQLPNRPRAGPWLFFKNTSTGIPLDLRPWVQGFRAGGSITFPDDSGDPARDLMAAFSRHDSLISELAEGLDRPHAQWILQGAATSPMSSQLDFDTVLCIERSLRIHAIAAAQSSDVNMAHTLALILLRLEEACLNRLLYTSGLSHCVPWEICNKRLGGYEDFARLEVALSRFDVRSYILMYYRSELARNVYRIQVAKNDRSKAYNGSLISSNYFALEFFPSGIFDKHCARLGERQFLYYIKPLKDGWRVALDVMAEQEKKMALNKWMADLTDSIRLTVPEKFRKFVPDSPPESQYFFERQYIISGMTSQAHLNQAVIGCALERYRIRHGDYPNLLDTVKRSDGTPLPLDVFNGKPLNYRRTEPNAYRLWSVGENGIDDGGMADDSLWLILGNSQSGYSN